MPSFKRGHKFMPSDTNAEGVRKSNNAGGG